MPEKNQKHRVKARIRYSGLGLRNTEKVFFTLISTGKTNQIVQVLHYASSVGTGSGNPGWVGDRMADWDGRQKDTRVVHAEGLGGWEGGREGETRVRPAMEERWVKLPAPHSKP